MTEKMYRDEIGKACKRLGVYRVEFSRTRCRLAQIYVDIEKYNGITEAMTQKIGEAIDAIRDHADDPDKALAQLAAAMDAMKLSDRLDRLRRTALEHERALGMTADSARKINDAVFSKKTDDDPLALALKELGA